MSRKKKPTIRYLSAGSTEDSYGQKHKESFALVPNSLLRSLAFQKLNNRQRLLVIYCLAKTFGYMRPYRDESHPAYEEYKTRLDTFYLSWHDVTKEFGLYADSDKSGFYKDMKTLEEHGIIKRLYKGTHKQKSIYAFDDDWIEWIPPPPEGL